MKIRNIVLAGLLSICAAQRQEETKRNHSCTNVYHIEHYYKDVQTIQEVNKYTQGSVRKRIFIHICLTCNSGQILNPYFLVFESSLFCN